MKWLWLILLIGASALAGEVAIDLPGEVATATAEGTQVVVSGNRVTFSADAGTRITPEVRLRDGTRIVGVDLSWYRSAKPAAEALSDDDRAEIREILTVPSFYDRAGLLRLTGDADRATGLVQLMRDRDFHAGRGEVIWRIELWYFEFANGGWIKVAQQNKVLDRQRFATTDAYRAYTNKLRFAPSLGALVAPESRTELRLSADDLIAVGETAR